MINAITLINISFIQLLFRGFPESDDAPNPQGSAPAKRVTQPNEHLIFFLQAVLRCV